MLPGAQAEQTSTYCTSCLATLSLIHPGLWNTPEREMQQVERTSVCFDSSGFGPAGCTDVGTLVSGNEGFRRGAQSPTCLPSFWLQASNVIWEPVEKEVMERHLSCCLIKGSLNIHSFGIRKRKILLGSQQRTDERERAFSIRYLKKLSFVLFLRKPSWEDYHSSCHLIRSLCSDLLHHDHFKACSWFPSLSQVSD